ncbi:sigma factor-like helix-turn-helix DNA-binding protein, partial [uncultured Duncaniella sp.]
IYRDVFDLSFEQGLKNAEIAHLLDIAEITVKKRKERLLNMLRAKLGGISEMELMMLLLYAGILSDVS